MPGRDGHRRPPRAAAAALAAAVLTAALTGCSSDDGAGGDSGGGDGAGSPAASSSALATTAPADFTTHRAGGLSLAAPEGFAPLGGTTVPTQGPSGDQQLTLATEPDAKGLRAAVIARLITEPAHDADRESDTTFRAEQGRKGVRAERREVTWDGRPAWLVTSRGAEEMAGDVVVRSDSLTADLPDGTQITVNAQAEDGTFTRLGLDRVLGTVRVGD